MPGRLRELDVLSRLGNEVRELMPAYRGPVRAGVCLAFEETAPRSWHGGTELEGRGGWVLGIDWLRPWLYAHGADHAIGGEQLRRLDAAAGPRWNRRTRARLPGEHNVG